MKAKTLKLPENLVNTLINLPESGMGYQIVKVFLKSGKVLNHKKVLNSELLMLEENEDLSVNEIGKIELDNIR
jgi:hypothetical protein